VSVPSFDFTDRRHRTPGGTVDAALQRITEGFRWALGIRLGTQGPETYRTRASLRPRKSFQIATRAKLYAAADQPGLLDFVTPTGVLFAKPDELHLADRCSRRRASAFVYDGRWKGRRRQTGCETVRIRRTRKSSSCDWENATAK